MPVHLNRDPEILRAQALALLKEASAIDGLLPFVVTHATPHGESVYVAWAKQMPDERDAAAILDCPFEPERRESLTVHDGLRLNELVGAAPQSVGYSQRPAPPSDAMSM